MANVDSKSFDWIAHRGSPTIWPENSIEGFRAALESGAYFIECDVQLSEDGIPILFHDAGLDRLTTRLGDVYALPVSELLQHDLVLPEHSFNKSTVKVSALSDLANLLADFPNATVFIELKTESIKHFGLECYLRAVLPFLARFITPVVIISFSSKVLAAIRSKTDYPIGWVIPSWNDENQQKANALQPDWLFCNRERLPDDNVDLWPGNWRWGLYTINDLQTARTYLQRGFTHLETNRILDLIDDRC